MLNTYMANHLEGDYGIWNDYTMTYYCWSFLFNFGGTPTVMNGGTEAIVADDMVPATVPNTRSDATPGSTIPNPLIGQPIIRKYISAAEWTRINTTTIWSSGKSPLALMAAGDPRWLQWFAADFAAYVPGTIGWFTARGSAWIGKEGAGSGNSAGEVAARAPIMWTPTGLPAGVTATPVEVRHQLPADYGLPELVEAWDTDGHVHQWKQGHALHHSIETQSQLGALLSTFQTARDMNNHTVQNFNTNGLPNSAANPLKLALAQEIACRADTYFPVTDNSAQGEWAWQVADKPVTPMNEARAGLAAQAIISYDLHNSLTQCNYTLPVWASPLKSRNGAIGSLQAPGGTAAVATNGYRGDPLLDVKVFNAVTGNNFTFAEYEKMGLRMYTMWRIQTARILSARTAGAGANMRTNFDQAPSWAFNPTNAVSAWGTLTSADWELAKDMLYDKFGYDKTTGNPTEATLTALGLDFAIPTLKAEGIIP